MDRRALSLAALPTEVLALLRAHDARPRLVAHLTLVHDVARHLVARLRASWPAIPMDAGAVAFGAATHDIGKALHPRELSEPGVLHEAAGEALLVRSGIAPSLARFARTHGSPIDADTALPLEDLLVVTADSIWKGRRSRALDDALVRTIGRETGASAWEAFMTLDEILNALAEDADQRLSWHARFPTTTSV